MLSRAHTRRSAVGRLKRPGRLLSCILNVVPQWHVKTWCRKVRWQLCCTTCCRRNMGQRDMLTTDRLDRSGAPKIGCTSGNEMRCPDHVVIEVETLQSFCRCPAASRSRVQRRDAASRSRAQRRDAASRSRVQRRDAASRSRARKHCAYSR